MTQEEKREVERLYFREGLSTKEIASEIGLYETDVIYYINKMIKDNPRRGEIRAAAERAYPYKDGTKGYICEGSIPIFIQGAEWADENPDERMIAKYLYEKKGYPIDLNGNTPSFEETMKDVEQYNKYKADKFIDKVCKWLEELFTESDENPYVVTYQFDSIQEMIEDLRKTMEE